VVKQQATVFSLPSFACLVDFCGTVDLGVVYVLS